MSMKIKKKFRRGKDGFPYHREENNITAKSEPQNETTTSDAEDPAEALNYVDQVALTHSDHYGYLMKKFEYVAMLEKNLVFSILGYDTQKRSIKQQEHIFIIRKAMKVPEGYDFLYSCSCDLERRQFAQSLGNEVTQPLETVFKDEACLHIEAFQIYVSQYDEEKGIDAQSLWSLGQASRLTEELDHKYHMEPPKVLQENIPVLFDLFSECAIPSLPLREMLKEMVDKCKAPFVDKNGLLKEPHSLVPTHQDNSMDGYFPCLPQIMERGLYVQDKLNKGRDECSKASTSKRRHPSLTPGLFIFNCIHGVCYGFQMMRNHESPDVPFTVLRTRFPKAPSVIIYDNSCKLHQYCLNRDPAFFRSSKFMVDKFHWLNHKACSEGYNISRYPKFSQFNSQAAEQLNSAIKPLASMLCYMQHDNFIHFTSLHIYTNTKQRHMAISPMLLFFWQCLILSKLAYCGQCCSLKVATHLSVLSSTEIIMSH